MKSKRKKVMQGAGTIFIKHLKEKLKLGELFGTKLTTKLEKTMVGCRCNSE